jgi:hypothetical protein
MAETQSTVPTTTEATAPTGDIKMFIDTFNKDFDIKLKSLLDNQQNYKNVYADAIKITTPKQGSWPNDPKVVTIGDLFKYTFPDIDSDNIITPPSPSSGDYENYTGWLKDLKNSKDEKISKMYSTISNGIRSNKDIKNYQDLKKPGITNPNLWSPGQYYFDIFMYEILSPHGPLKDPREANGGGIFSTYDFIKAQGGSVSVSNFDPSGEVDLSKHDKGTDSKLDYYEFYQILDGGYVGSGIKYTTSNITGVSIGLGDQSPNKPVSFTSLKTQYRSGLLIDLDKDPKFNKERGDVEVTTGQFTGNYEHILLYKAFIQAGDNYKPVVLPLRNPETPAPAPEVATKPIVNLPQEVGYTFNVEKKDSFVIVGGGSMSGIEFTIVPNDGTQYIINEAPINNINDEDELDDEYREDGYQGTEESLTELAKQNAIVENLQADLPPETKGSDFKVSDTTVDDGKYVGAAWKGFNIDSAISKIDSTKYKPVKFKESLKQVLYYIKNDPDIKDMREGAYMLGTAYAESKYSLQRWEADYACTGEGVPYGPAGPCSKATNYYRSTKDKKDYYTLGVDSKGQCYFGRGLIQLTGKDNYKTYGSKIGVDLLGNGDLALAPQNSYKIASTYMRGRTFKYVTDPNAKLTIKNNKTGTTNTYTGLTAARRSINGGEKEIDTINAAYSAWLEIFKSLSTSTSTA